MLNNLLANDDPTGVIIGGIIIGLVALFIIRMISNRMSNGDWKTWVIHQVVETLFFLAAFILSFFITDSNAIFTVGCCVCIFLGEFWSYSILDETTHTERRGKLSVNFFDELEYEERDVSVTENGFFDTIWTSLIFSAIYIIATMLLIEGGIPLLWCIPTGFGFVKRLLPTITKVYSLFRK